MSPTLRRTTLAGVLALTLGFCAPARAGQLRFDLTGTWTGTIKCKGLFGGAKDKFSIDPVMTISQNGFDMGLVLDFGGGDREQYIGIANPDAKKPDKKGEVAIVYCGTDDQVGVLPDFDEIGRMSVSSKPGKVKASFKGTTIFSDFSNPGPLPAGSYTCKWKYTRSNTFPPGVQLQCPAL